MPQSLTIHICNYQGDVLDKIQTKTTKMLQENSVFALADDIYEVIEVLLNHQSNEMIVRALPV